MTFVGKILVILIMAFSLVFLGVSTVVFSTAKSWKTEAESQKTKLTKEQSRSSVLEAGVKDAQSKLDTAKTEHSKAVTERENRIKDLEKKIADAESQETAARSQLEVAQKNAQVALAEATARKSETETSAKTLTLAQNQANEFNKQNLELTDQIRILQREKATAEQNAKDLRNYKARTIALLQQYKISPEAVDRADPSSAVPVVDGRVKEVNAKNDSVEITIGSNDGLATGQVLQLFRHQPKAEYLGQVKIVSVYPNKAVADVINQTVNRKRILEGDIVSSTFDIR